MQGSFKLRSAGRPRQVRRPMPTVMADVIVAELGDERNSGGALARRGEALAWSTWRAG
ncbi:MAG: hypothetical protein K6T81_04090 [Alicyclobacillus macrosporangiidus]|uniref:hypothetical protein n=1 Tax=Alicyclobacillus macrosporangiidus TaxID=392015 RepID=UPI0026EEA884|nr:hypothetical protein [Alicyclobacillus macrosporangiidus]MCL6597898.1 hypothetical protein [Alicyclobacillus macrosporangiidus]